MAVHTSINELEIYAHRNYCRYKYPLLNQPYREYKCWYNLFGLKTWYWEQKYNRYKRLAEKEFMKRT